jgi:mono/diheme cytochrome c family protein
MIKDFRLKDMSIATKKQVPFCSFGKCPFQIFLMILFAGLFLSSCDYNRRTTGWDYAGDMINSNAYETYSPNPVFADGQTMQPPVEGTIPRGFMPYAYLKTDEDRALAAITLVNEMENTAANLERGKVAYGIYCMLCHGEKGDGQGSLYVNKKYNYPPASLISEKMRANPEADIYHVITVGWGIMGEHGSMISPDDRWKIAMYVKQKLQN